MTREDKQLLLKDISARLPYGVKVQFDNIDTYPAILEGIDNHLIICDITICELEDVKPYLRPMSSMSVEHRCKVQNLLPDNCEISFKNQKITFYGECNNIQLEQLEKVFNFFNLFHFDYRGLIEKGLALEAPEGMYN